MSLRNFEGDAFVAFTDISGFKQLMKDGKALEALDCLYTSGYKELQNQPDVCGLFVSDCGILYTTGDDKASQFEKLLSVVKNINKKMLKKNFMLTTSIAYGYFSYRERIEFLGIQKTPLYGPAYVDAYLDNENGLPKIQPGKCRIKRKYIDDSLLQENRFKNHLYRINDYYYFYWNVKDSSDIESFEKSYSNTYNRKYMGMLEALRQFNDELPNDTNRF